MKRLIICLLTVFLLFSCAAAEDCGARTMLESMTLREKVGQLFFVRPDALDAEMEPSMVNDTGADGLKYVTDSVRASFADYPVGGVVIFGKNIESPDQLASLIADLKAASPLPLLFAIDEEGGSVARIANSGVFNVKKYLSMERVARDGDTEKARDVGRTIGAYLKDLGILLDFAPVADVNSNPRNTVIGARAFGSDPALAAQMVAAAVQGFHEAGVACTLKHFPGHGDTAEDTHSGDAYAWKTWEEMKACEMIPFAAGIEAGADLVMTAHIQAPNVTGNSLPASLSHEIVTQKLRGELGFAGVVITDALTMDAIRFEYSSEECCVMALQAGCDILLMPSDFPAAFQGVMNAVHQGVIPMERIDESVYRILCLKEKYGLLRGPGQ